MKDSDGETALDHAVQKKNPSAALYLFWLGAECKEENRKYKEGVTWHTWKMAARRENSVEKQNRLITDSQYWAVVANDRKSLKKLISCLKRKNKENKLDVENLRTLAKLYNRRNIGSVCGDIAGLQSLAWEELQQCTPAVTGVVRAAVMLKKVPSNVVVVLINVAI